MLKLFQNFVNSIYFLTFVMLKKIDRDMETRIQIKEKERFHYWKIAYVKEMLKVLWIIA